MNNTSMGAKRILLLANSWVGKEICTFLTHQKNAILVGLGVHEKEKQKLTQEIIALSKLSSDRVFLAHQLKEEKTLDVIGKLHPDLVISAFWGYILKKPLLDIPSMGSINFHPGYLPYNRGMNPNVWPIIEGTPAGVTLHFIDEGIDSGDIIVRKKIPIKPWDTAETIYDKTLVEIVRVFKKTWPDIASGKTKRTPQLQLKNESSTFHYAKDIEKLAEIDLDMTYTGRELINLLRARSYNDRYYLSYIDGGKKVYIRVQLSDSV